MSEMQHQKNIINNRTEHYTTLKVPFSFYQLMYQVINRREVCTSQPGWKGLFLCSLEVICGTVVQLSSRSIESSKAWSEVYVYLCSLILVLAK